MDELEKKEGLGNNSIFTISLLICAGVIFLCLILCHFAPAPDSDKAEGVIWADEALRCGHLLNPEFVYPYAIPFGSNMFILPFAGIFGIGQIANSLGMLLFFLVCSAVCFMFVKALKDTKKYIVLAGTITILFPYCSRGIGGDFANHILHYQLGIICILGILGAVLRVTNNKNEQGIVYYVTIVFFSVWSGANGLPTILFSCASVLSALMLFAIFERYNGKKVNRKILYSFICIFVGTIIGYILYKIIMINVSESDYLQNTGSFNFRSINEWIDNIYHFPVDWINLFMICNPQGVSAFGWDCMRILISVSECLLISSMPVLYVYRYRKLGISEKIIFLTSAFVWGISLAQYVFFRGPEGRLLFVPCFMNFVLLAVWMIKSDFLLKRKNHVIIVAVSVLAVFQVISYVHSLQWKVDDTLVNKIKETGIDYGFGGYWDANFNTVNSNGQIKIRGVAFNEGEISPYVYSSESNWYEKNNLGEEFFVIINREEMDKAESYPESVIDEMYKEKIECGDKYILIFDSDVWDRGFRYVTD